MGSIANTLSCNVRQKRALVVEDDPDINELISFNLRSLGLDVEQVFDGSLALELIKQNTYDIAILDIMLPNVDGFILCKELQQTKMKNKTFVVVVSAKSEPSDKLFASLLGADCYLTKPFSVGMLSDIINEFSVLINREYSVSGKFAH
jgi:two-component system alkaline phosphatase synthesis response regulator PhoP